MSRNLKLIIIFSAGILLLVCALIALSCDSCGQDVTLPATSDSDMSGEAVSSSQMSGIHLHANETGELLVDKDELQSLRLTSSLGDYFITRGSDGELTIQSLSGLLLETDFIEIVWYNALSFGYTYSLHAEGDVQLSDYGLDPAALTIECVYTDGTSCRLFVGNSTPTSPNIYYFRMEGREEIFINEFDGSFFQGDTYWLSDDIFGDDVDDVTIGEITLTGSDFGSALTIVPNNAKDKSHPFYGYNYIIKAPNAGPADNYLMTMLTDELTELVADEAVCAHPTEEQLAEYGLDRPHVIISHQRNGAKKVLRIARADATTLYAIADGVDCVFMLSANVFPSIAALSPDSLRSADIHIRYFDSVNTIRIQSGDIDYTFRLERTPLETDNTLFEYRAYYGDTQLTLNYYKNLLEVFNSAAAVSYDGRRESDSPVMTVTITFFDGFERREEVVRYYPSGTRRYLAEIDGSGSAVVGQMWVDKLLKSASSLARNEEVNP